MFSSKFRFGFLLMDILFITQVLAVDLRTTNECHYKSLRHLGLPAPGMDYLAFQVKACNNAHLLLMSSSGNLYEIIIGGWSNSRSRILNRNQGIVLARYNGPVLSCAEFRGFSVRWGDNKIVVTKESSINFETILEYQTESQLFINAVWVCTGLGATGQWSFNDDAVDDKSIFTLARYDYKRLTALGIPYLNQNFISFEVKACNDAHIALTSSNGAVYEVVVGGWSNTKSCIRNRNHGSCLTTNFGPVLSCDDFTELSISWDNNKIAVVKGFRGSQSSSSILQYNTGSQITVQSVEISTGWGSTGFWIFKERETPTLHAYNMPGPRSGFGLYGIRERRPRCRWWMRRRHRYC